VASTGFAVLRAKKGLVPRFLYYLVGDQVFTDYLVAHADGSAYPAVNARVFAEAEVLLPPLPKQRAIAHILGTLDDKIELNRRLSATLEEMARALFKAWFVDFEPVRAKLAGREPASAPGELAALFPSRLVPSELGEIPEGWKTGTLAEFVELNPESWSESTAPQEIEYVDLANTKWGTIESTATYAWQDAPSRARRVLRPGDTIIGTVRPGNGSYAYILQGGLTGSTGFAALRPRVPELREYVYLASTPSDNIQRLAHLADGAAYPAVRPEAVTATAAIRTTAPILQGFSEMTRPFTQQISGNTREAHTLAALRDALLPRLISGELRVEDAERWVEEVI
jgi:type I restriction enzyme S subunit